MDKAELDTLQIKLADGSISPFGVTSFQLDSQMLDPVDSAMVTISDDRMAAIKAAFIPGSQVQILINGHPVLTGPVVDLEQSDSMTSIKIFGFLHSFIVSQVDPSVKFLRGMTVQDVFVDCTKSYYGSIPIDSGDSGNQKVISGQKVTDGETDPAAKVISQIKPKDLESNKEYLDRVCMRQGLTYWGSGDGESIIVAKPNFKDGSMKLIRKLNAQSGANNIEQASASYNFERQPSIVVVGAQVATSGEEKRIRAKAAAVNELVGLDFDGNRLPEVQAILDKKEHVASRVLDYRGKLTQYRQWFAPKPTCKPIFLEDKNAQTQEEAEKLARRTLSDLQRQAFQASIEVQGWSQNGTLWAPNTMVAMMDEKLGLDLPLYVFKRTFMKSRSGGTTTRLTLILPYTIALDDE